MRTSIRLSGARYRVHIGTTDAERAFPQQLEFEVKLDIDYVPHSGLENSVCWDTADKFIADVLVSQKWILLEDLVVDLAEALLKKFPPAHGVWMLAKKFPFEHCSWVGVEYSKAREG